MNTNSNLVSLYSRLISSYVDDSIDSNDAGTLYDDLQGHPVYKTLNCNNSETIAPISMGFSTNLMSRKSLSAFLSSNLSSNLRLSSNSTFLPNSIKIPGDSISTSSDSSLSSNSAFANKFPYKVHIDSPI